MSITESLNNSLRITELRDELSKLSPDTEAYKNRAELINLLIIQEKYKTASTKAFTILCKRKIAFNPQNKDALTTVLIHYEKILNEWDKLSKNINFD